MTATLGRPGNAESSAEQEDCSDPNGDSRKEKGAEALQTPATWPPIQPVPAWRGIPDSLYDKAFEDPDQLSEEERRILLSRGDVVGKALATPYDLTTAEIHEVLLWPPPDVTSANIQRATGGTLSSPQDLFAKAKDALDRGQLDTMLSYEEVTLLTRYFHGPEDEDFSYEETTRRIKSRGPGRAYELIFSGVGLDDSVMAFAACSTSKRAPLVKHVYVPRPRPPGRDQLTGSLAFLHDQVEAALDAEAAFKASLPPLHDRSWTGGYRPVPKTDLETSAPWPPGPVKPIGAFAVLQAEIEPGCAGSKFDSPEWHRLPEAQKDAYRARAEALRREAWAGFERICAARKPGAIYCKKGFEHFQGHLGKDVTFWDALAKWDAFTEQQRSDWEKCASDAFENEQRRQRKMWEIRDLSPEEKEEAQSPVPQGGRGWGETVEEWRARRAREKRLMAEGDLSIQRYYQLLAENSILSWDKDYPRWWDPGSSETEK